MIIADLLSTVRPRLKMMMRIDDFTLTWYNAAGVFVTVVQSSSGFNLFNRQII